jgi:hypothetical protein
MVAFQTGNELAVDEMHIKANSKVLKHKHVAAPEAEDNRRITLIPAG